MGQGIDGGWDVGSQIPRFQAFFFFFFFFETETVMLRRLASLKLSLSYKPSNVPKPLFETRSHDVTLACLEFAM